MNAKRFAVAIVCALSLLGAACSSHSSHRTLMPPRMDLRAYGTIGMLDFSSATSRGQLDVRAGREFLSAIQSAQPGVPVLELGDKNAVLASVGHRTLDPDAVRAIGKRHHVDVLVVGLLDAQEVRPRLSVTEALDAVHAGAELQGALTVKMYETRSGATLWSSAVRGSQPIARMRLAGGDLTTLRASDPAEVGGRLVHELVGRATVDFWPYWVND
jgi:hypothetical protein